MTEEDRLAIGRAEDAARKRDIAAVKRGDMDIGVAQQNCRIRALASGMSELAYFNAMVDAQISSRSM